MEFGSVIRLVAEYETNEATKASSIFFVALIVSQWGHLISVRRRTPYFSDAILNTNKDPAPLVTRLWQELMESRPRLPIVIAIVLSLARQRGSAALRHREIA